MSLEDAEHFRRKAARCRELAASILLPSDPTRKVIEQLAAELEARAAALISVSNRQLDEAEGDTAVGVQLG